MQALSMLAQVGVPLTVLEEYGPWGLVGLFVVLVLTGKLVPKSILDRADKTITLLTEANTNQSTRNDLLLAQVKEMIQTQRLTVEILQSIRRTAGIDEGTREMFGRLASDPGDGVTDKPPPDEGTGP